MVTPQKGSDKHFKVRPRVGIIILGVFLFSVGIILPVITSYAQVIEQLDIKQYLPLIYKEHLVLPTQTPTPTHTKTPAATITPATPTKTGTQPTPTRTGTLTFVPSLKVSVSPSQAKINESFTFTIEAGNNGSGVIDNNLVLDSFPTYIDVSTVSSTRGSITKLSHSFVVTIGSISPGEKVTIIAVVKVNGTLTRTESQTNVVTLTYGTSRSLTAGVNYKVIFQTLPGTGELPLNWRESVYPPRAKVPGVLVMGLSLFPLLISFWSKIRSGKYNIWLMAAGGILLIVGFIWIGKASGWLTQAHPSSQINSLTRTAAIGQMQPAEPSATRLPHMPAWAFSTPEAVTPIVTLPDYPIPTPEITITPQQGEQGPDISPVVRIAIPALFLDTEVKYVPYDGVTWLITGLRQEVAWMGNTSWPGLGGNTALAGHVTVAGLGDGPFRNLDTLGQGEAIILYTEKSMYTYNVVASHVTDDGDMSPVLPSDTAEVTLITCVDWDQDAHTYRNRLVVVADLVQTEPITMGSSH